MTNVDNTRRKGPASEPNPILIQSYFDGELESDELEALSLEAIRSHPMLEALEELRGIVRYDSQQALEDIDDMALFNAIHRQIASEKQVLNVAKTQAAPSPLGSRLKKNARWIPALVGAALVLLSLPGFMMLFSKSEHGKSDKPQEMTCVSFEGHTKTDPLVAAQNDMDGRSIRNEKQNDKLQIADMLQVAVPRLQMQNHDDQQLTVQEMDFAIRHLINRIESLEDANRNPYDTGDIGLTRPAFEPLNGGHNL